MLETSEIRNGIRVDWNVPITVDDGTLLRADVFRPVEPGRYPVLMSYGPYAKGLSFQEGYPAQWQQLVAGHPEVAEGTTTEFANWETADPEKWVPMGYVCIRVDSRGAGQSPGKIDPWSEREVQDYYDCIEWAAVQDWSNGNIGLAGVSYYAMNQWAVAAKRPPHLKAICPFEGNSDHYREVARQGGILSTFLKRWFPIQVMNVQHGLGERARTNPTTREGIAGDTELTDAERAANRTDPHAELLTHPLRDDYYRQRSPDLSRIEVPILSCGNWGGLGLHLRGNVEGYLGAASSQKWLELHGREHWTEFYTDYGIALQKQFFDHFLKGEQNGWDQRPPVLLQVRHVDGFTERAEAEWPLPDTRWTRMYLDFNRMALTDQPPATAGSASYKAIDEVLTFYSDPFPEETEITGPSAAQLFAASSTTDADLFLTLRLFDPEGREVLFSGAIDPNCPVSMGWLRASHRKLDLDRSTPYRPYHSHDEIQPLTPGETYRLDIEIWPTSIVIPKGYRLALTIGGKDYEHDLPGPLPTIYGVEQRGCSVLLHDDPEDRPEAIYGGKVTLSTDPDHPASILLPFIPAR